MESKHETFGEGSVGKGASGIYSKEASWNAKDWGRGETEKRREKEEKKE